MGVGRRKKETPLALANNQQSEPTEGARKGPSRIKTNDWKIMAVMFLNLKHKKVPTKKEEKWRLENYSRGPEHDAAASWTGRKSSRWNKKGEHKKKMNERIAGKKEKRDINYSRKQEQQIPIKDDWQMPSCFKCLLRLVIVGGIRVRSFRRLR